MLVSSPVAAQLSGSATVASDDRLRGHSISAGDPVVAGSVAYDAAGGWYVEGSAALAIDSQLSPRLTSIAADAGYARRMAADLTIDAGITRFQRTGVAPLERTIGYTEIYAGLSNRNLSVRIALSPDYFLPGRRTLYASVAYVAHPLPKWSLGGHLGALTMLSEQGPAASKRPVLDEAVTLTRRLGQIDMGLALTSTAAGSGAPTASGPRLVANASIAF